VPEVGVPVEVVTSGEPELLTRIDDSAPWWGGSHMNNANGRGNCSSAFPVTNASGGQWMLTAAHCGTPYDAFNDGTGERMGSKIDTRSGKLPVITYRSTLRRAVRTWPIPRVGRPGPNATGDGA
jgi:hypothetical protein